MTEKFNNKIDAKTALKLLEGFKKRFVISDYDPKNQHRSRLLWCNLSCNVQIIPTEKFETIPLIKDKKVYFYNERTHEMYEVSFSEICTFVSELEPWEEIDAEIFDCSYEWFIAITHEDVSMVYGLGEF